MSRCNPRTKELTFAKGYGILIIGYDAKEHTNRH